MALASRSVEHVLAAVKASAQKQEETSPASVSGVSNSFAHDADAAALASKSVEKVLQAMQLPEADGIHSVATDGPVVHLDQLNPAEIARVAAEEAIRAEQAAREQAEETREGGSQHTQTGEQQADAAASSGGTSVGHHVAAEIASRAAAVGLGGAGDTSVHAVAHSDATSQPGHPTAPFAVPTTISEVTNSLAQQPQADVGGIVSTALAEAARDDTEMTVVAASDEGSLAQLDPAQLALAVAEAEIRAEEAVKEQQRGAMEKAGGGTDQPARTYTREDRPTTPVSTGGTSVGHPVAADVANRAAAVALEGAGATSVHTLPAVTTTISEVTNSVAQQPQADVGGIVFTALAEIARDAEMTVIATTSDEGSLAQLDRAQLALAVAEEAIRAEEAVKERQRAMEKAGGGTDQPARTYTREDRPTTPVSTGGTSVGHPVAADVANRAAAVALEGAGATSVHTLPAVTTTISEVTNSLAQQAQADFGRIVSSALDQAAHEDTHTTVIAGTSDAAITQPDAAQLASAAADGAIRAVDAGKAARAQGPEPISPVSVEERAADVPYAVDVANRAVQLAVAGEGTGSEVHTLVAETASEVGQPGMPTVVDRAVEAAVTDREEEAVSDVSHFPDHKVGIELVHDVLPKTILDGPQAGGGTVVISEASHATTTSKDAQRMAEQAADQAIHEAIEADGPLSVIVSDGGVTPVPPVAEHPGTDVPASAGEDVHAASAAHGGRGEGKEQGHEAAEPSNFGGSMAHHPAQPPIQPERGPEAVTTITEVSQAAQTMVIGATGDAGTLLQPHAELPAVAEEAIQADADRQADASASQSRLDQLGVSQTSMQGSHGSQGVSQTSFHVSQTTFQVSQSTFQASHTTFDPGEPTQSTFQTGHNANLFNSTAPAVVGVQQGPRVPPLWDPHPRSDGFYGWEARSPSDASDADHPALPADTLPTFVPAVDDRDATLPASDLHGHWADPGAQTVKPHSGFTARSGYSDDSSGQSPRPGQPIVNTSILTQLCNLLNAPDTPDSEVERVRRGPLRKVRTPEEQSPAWGGGVPSASAASPISPFQAETEVTITTSPAKTKKSMHSAARSADETLPSLHPSTSGPHDAYGHEDDQSPFQTVPMFQSDLHSPPERRDRRVPEEPAADLFQRRTPRSHQEAEELVDPNLISQLCHLLNAPDTPSSAAAAAAAAAAAEVHKPSRAAAATAEASKVKQPSRAKPAEETLQRPSDPMSGWAEPGETLPMFQSDLHSPQTPDERRARRDREHARHRADPFDMDFDQTATARTDEESRQQSLVDPNLIAQLCRLLNQPETPPSDTERIRREPPPRRAKEQPGMFLHENHKSSPMICPL